MKTKYTYETIALAVEERFFKRRKPGTTGIGEHAEMESVSIGWWMTIQGAHPFAVHLGDERPTHRAGDKVTVTIEV